MVNGTTTKIRLIPGHQPTSEHTSDVYLASVEE